MFELIRDMFYLNNKNLKFYQIGLSTMTYIYIDIYMYIYVTCQIKSRWITNLPR